MMDKSQPQVVILCADDFAISPAVSTGILELIQAKRLSAVSCMAGSSFFPKQGQLLRAFSAQIDIGIHLLLTDLTPMGPIPSLTVEGRLPSFRAIVKSSKLTLIQTREIKKEFERQIDAFVKTIGRLPDFIDGHQHVHQIPAIQNIILEIIDDRFDNAPYIRICHERLSTILYRGVAIGRAIAIGWWGRSLRQKVNEKNIPTNNGFSGIYDFSNKIPYSKLFDHFTQRITTGSLIICHPGHVDDSLREFDSLTDQREIELAYFKSDEFATLLNQKNLVLGRFNSIPQPSS